MLKKIVITGPESTGKTTLAEQLASALGGLWVPEYARQYVHGLNRQYVENDLVEMAKGQLKIEQEYEEKVHEYLIYDTDLITIKIWAEHKYGKCDPFILNAIEKREYNFYFLTGIDVPWEYDPQRESPNNRAELYKLYKKELEFYKKTFVELKGNEGERLELALSYIKKAF